MKKFLFFTLFAPLLAGAQTNNDSLKYISSVKYYSKAIAQEPNNADYYHKRGTAYLNLDNFNEALNDLNKSISMDVKTEETFFDRGRTYFALKDYDMAFGY
jgi:tetratricopeptide (TPR) repeat protein